MLWDRFAMEFTYFPLLSAVFMSPFSGFPNPLGFGAYYTINSAKIKRFLAVEVYLTARVALGIIWSGRKGKVKVSRGETKMSVSWNDFLSFRYKSKQEERHFHDEKTQQFFATLLTTAKERIESILKGQIFWRAQLNCDYQPACDLDGTIIDNNAVPYSSERMKPLADKASEGRINSKGIPCLYLSTDEKTAISEVRPWVGSYVTVAQFETLRELKVIDCSCGEINPMCVSVADLDKLYKLNPPTPEEAIKTIWRWIDKAFSEAVEHNDKIADYVPTQIIAELFKTNGFDGIQYKSLFNNGMNLALYDIDSAKQIDDGKVIQVINIDVGFEQKWPTQFKQRGK